MEYQRRIALVGVAPTRAHTANLRQISRRQVTIPSARTKLAEPIAERDVLNADNIFLNGSCRCVSAFRRGAQVPRTVVSGRHGLSRAARRRGRACLVLRFACGMNS